MLTLVRIRLPGQPDPNALIAEAVRRQRVEMLQEASDEAAQIAAAAEAASETAAATGDATAAGDAADQRRQEVAAHQQQQRAAQQRLRPPGIEQHVVPGAAPPGVIVRQQTLLLVHQPAPLTLLGRIIWELKILVLGFFCSMVPGWDPQMAWRELAPPDPVRLNHPPPPAMPAAGAAAGGLDRPAAEVEAQA